MEEISAQTILDTYTLQIPKSNSSFFNSQYNSKTVTHAHLK